MEEQLQEIASSRGVAGSGDGDSGRLPQGKATAAGGARGRAQREAELLGALLLPAIA